MTNEAKYTFISYLRKGLAAQLKIGDALGEIVTTSIEKIGVDVKITLEGTDPGSVQEDFTKEYSVVGPGEILGINENVVVRKSPKPGDRSFSPSFIPFIEFYSEDFPWRFTPLAAVKESVNAADITKRVRPWVTLVVLAENEFIINHPTQGLPGSFTLNDVAIDEVFPSEKDIWAWAHIQVNKAVTDIEEYESALSDNPDNAISRILCPRKLKPFTKYHAFLIPTFKRGLEAGLGIEPTADIQESAWANNTIDVTFPYYLTWQFATDDYTDFESLASKIKPGLPSPDLGKLKLDISELNYPDLENWMAVNAFDGILEMDGILRPPPGMDPIDDEIKETYRKLINLTDDYKTKDDQTIGNVYLNGKDAEPESIDPIVTIPFYGQWYAAKTRADESEDEYWLNTMNLDPRYRLAIGVGSEIVRKESDDFLKRAWKQGGNLLHVNKTLRLLQHSYLVSNQILNKHLSSLPEEELLSLFGPMLKRVLIACSYPSTTISPPPYVENPLPPILTPVTLGFTQSQFTASDMGSIASVTWTIIATETLDANLDINLTETGQGGQLSSLVATIIAGNSSTSVIRNYNMVEDSYDVYMAIEEGVNYNTDNAIDNASSQIPPLSSP